MFLRQHHPFVGIHTPDASPNGSPEPNDAALKAAAAAASAHDYLMANGQQQHQLHQQQQQHHQQHHLAPSTLPTPEMSPMDPDKEGFSFSHEESSSSGPIGQLMTKFSSHNSRHLKHVIPPYRQQQQRSYNGNSNVSALRQLVTQHPVNGYTISITREPTYNPQPAFYQHHPHDPQAAQTAGAMLVDPSSCYNGGQQQHQQQQQHHQQHHHPSPSPTSPAEEAAYMTHAEAQQHHLVFPVHHQQQQQQQQQHHHPLEHFTEAELLDDVDRNEFDQYLKGGHPHPHATPPPHPHSAHHQQQHHPATSSPQLSSSSGSSNGSNGHLNGFSSELKRHSASPDSSRSDCEYAGLCYAAPASQHASPGTASDDQQQQQQQQQHDDYGSSSSLIISALANVRELEMYYES